MAGTVKVSHLQNSPIERSFNQGVFLPLKYRFKAGTSIYNLTGYTAKLLIEDESEALFKEVTATPDSDGDSVSIAPLLGEVTIRLDDSTTARLDPNNRYFAQLSLFDSLGNRTHKLKETWIVQA